MWLEDQHIARRAPEPGHPSACSDSRTARQHAVYHNFVLPHATLRQALLQPEPTHGTGSAKTWWPRTPAMAASLTDHVWTLREVLLLRVPAWLQTAGV